MEIAVKFFFTHFTYTFGGDIFIQMFGGPIGARLTMCLARIVLQQWREDFLVIIEKSELRELLSWHESLSACDDLSAPAAAARASGSARVYYMHAQRQQSNKKNVQYDQLTHSNTKHSDNRILVQSHTFRDSKSTLSE